jgi:hypothetical protein
MQKVYNRVLALRISGIIIRGRKYPEMPVFSESDTEVTFIGKSLYRAWNEQKKEEGFHDFVLHDRFTITSYEKGENTATIPGIKCELYKKSYFTFITGYLFSILPHG